MKPGPTVSKANARKRFADFAHVACLSTGEVCGVRERYLEVTGGPAKTAETLLHLHLSLRRKGRWGTTGDFTTSLLHFSLFSTVLWD